MSGKLKGIEPESVMKYFEALSAVPRGSGKTQAATAFCVDFAKEHRLEYYTDETGNVIIYKKGSPGFENSEPVIIQGHLDMVCEKAPDVSFDFETEGLKLAVDGDYINASGTTLGGDDGIAVAMALAILENDSIKHPPIEAVFTVDEETGMFGAAALDTSVLKGRKMLNIDSEEEGTLLVSCAGGVRADVIFEAETALAFGDAYTVTITGLHGGHSGTEIDKGYISANKLMAEVLGTLLEKNNIRLCSVNGGTMDNAITRECKAVVTTRDVHAFEYEVEKLRRDLKRKYANIEPGFALYPTERELPEKSFDAGSTRLVISLLKELPQGVVSMSGKIDGMVETSLNMGVLKTEQNKVTCVFAVRSSVDSKKENLVESIKKTAAAYGATVRTHSSYPAWEFVENSPLQKVMSDVYMRQYGKKMNVTAIHAGLECGIFCGKIKGLDCVSFGPDILEIHTPRERLSISSVERVWKYLLAVLEELSVPEPKPVQHKPAETRPVSFTTNQNRQKTSAGDKAIIAFITGCFLFSFAVSIFIHLDSTGTLEKIPIPQYKYNKAVELIEQEQYDEAYEILDRYSFKRLYNYRDAYGLYSLCKSHIEYDKNNRDKAWDSFDSYRIFRNSDLNEDISKQNIEYGKELESYSRKKEEEIRNNERERAINGVPYVGMSEDYINITTLGRASSVVKNENGFQLKKRRYDATHYYFNNVYGKTVFSATCALGKVQYIWDNRKEAAKDPYPATKRANRTTTAKRSYDYDEYDVDEFGDAEDFYDWYYDDFYDYEEAEEYFDEYY